MWIKILSSLLANFKALSLYDIIISKIYSIFFMLAFALAAAVGNKTKKIALWKSLLS